MVGFGYDKVKGLFDQRRLGVQVEGNIPADKFWAKGLDVYMINVSLYYTKVDAYC